MNVEAIRQKIMSGETRIPTDQNDMNGELIHLGDKLTDMYDHDDYEVRIQNEKYCVYNNKKNAYYKLYQVACHSKIYASASSYYH
jgi:hypothetical protein